MNTIESELLTYLIFLAGQWLFILKRMAMAIRSQQNPIKTRRQYLYQNWDLILVRTALNGIIFLLWRHGQIPTFITNHTNWTIPPFLDNSPAAAGLLGYFSDSLSDWLLTQKWMPAWLQKDVPALPFNGTAQVAGKASLGDQSPSAPPPAK